MHMPISPDTREEITGILTKNLKKFSPPMVVVKESEGGFSMIGNKPVPYGSTKKIIPGMFFAAVENAKDSVAFHFFPCYMNKEMLEVAPTLVKKLKGKTCFHFKKVEDVNEKELNALLKKGVSAWKKMGYMK
jgi:hypothetical protein